MVDAKRRDWDPNSEAWFTKHLAAAPPMTAERARKLSLMLANMASRPPGPNPTDPAAPAA